TVTVAASPASGNQIVTGNNTLFQSTVNVGDFLWIGGNRVTVLKIDSDTQLEIPNGSLGTVSTGIPYSISVPQYTIDPAQKHGNQCLIDPKDPKPCGPTVPETNRLWWDVFPIPSGNTFYAGANATSVDVPGYFKMRSRFVDFSGYYVMHCHILAHEDRGMMTVVDV